MNAHPGPGRIRDLITAEHQWMLLSARRLLTIDLLIEGISIANTIQPKRGCSKYENRRSFDLSNVHGPASLKLLRLNYDRINLIKNWSILSSVMPKEQRFLILKKVPRRPYALTTCIKL